MYKKFRLFTLMLLAICLWFLPACKKRDNVSGNVLEKLELSELASGFINPVYIAHADDTGRLFVVEQGGLVKIIENGVVLEQAFLNLEDKLVRDNWEQGLLSVAFHPEFSDTGRFFVFYVSNERQQGVIAEYSVSEDPSVANPTGKVLLEVETAMGAHYGGHLMFGSDGYLYISVGDGYRRPERFEGELFPAQDLSNLPGSILRIDIDNGDPYAIPETNPFVGRKGVREEIWAYGFKNPWRFSFDAKTGDLFVGDVGLYAYEEVSNVKKGGNYGWAIREGKKCYVQTARGRAGCYLASVSKRMKAPIVDYPHLEQDQSGGNAVTGGYVYRGEEFPALDGVYFFADFIAGKIWALQKPGSSKQELVFDLPATYSSFGEGPNGELYVVDWGTGTIYELIMSS